MAKDNKSSQSSSTFFELIVRAFRDTAKQKAHNLALGQCETYSDYRFVCGEIAGLNAALILFEDIVKKNLKEEQDGVGNGDDDDFIN